MREAVSEKKLWRYVLDRGLRDALAQSDPKVTGSASQDRVNAIRKAKAWIGSTDFYEVCYLAGFDPEAVKERVRAGKVDMQAEAPGHFSDYKQKPVPQKTQATREGVRQIEVHSVGSCSSVNTRAKVSVKAEAWG